VLGEFGDDPYRYARARARKDYAGTSPITCQSGKKKTVHARHMHNDRLLDALGGQAQSALTASPGARAYYVSSATEASATPPPCVSWPNASSASCTAA
jgi:hypothetical protein